MKHAPVYRAAIAAASISFVQAGSVFAHDSVVLAQLGNRQLTGHTHDLQQPYPVGESSLPGIPGYATFQFGFEALEFPMPSENIFPMNSTSIIQAVLIASDPGITMIDSLTPVPIGGVITFGQPLFHYHPVTNIPNGVIGQVYSMTFIFRDATGFHPDSDPVRIEFTPVPTPAGFTVLLVGAAAFAHRRRSRG